jgi:polysaccharide pyruvyl transferase WcaK-like protein
MISRGVRSLWSRMSCSGSVLVEPSDVVLRNAGDAAMLEVAVTRLATLFPDAPILVLSDTPALVPRYRPNVVPIDTVGRRAWLNGNTRNADALAFVDAVASARLVAVAGMGGITDAFTVYALGVLSTLDLAIRHGVPTAMMGQGIGPLSDSALRARAVQVLPRVDWIALREGRAGLPLLRALGVPGERVCTTGDDAIELAVGQGGGDAPGWGLGVNLRASDYSGVNDDIIASVRLGVQRAGVRVHAQLLAVPISRATGEEDAATIRRLVGGYEAVLDEGFSIDTPQAVVEQIKRCRVVVTGSYHAGVFALACGIPVVGLARSTYYLDKFFGLAEQFGCGCEVVILDDADVPDRIDAAIRRLWAEAEELRADLRTAAERQIAEGRAAYQHLRSLVGRRRVGRAVYKYGRALAATWLK